jgi:hypothetical protein
VTVAESLGGPVSAALEADLRQQARRHGVVVWLDSDGHYTAFVDRLVAAHKPGELPYELRGFRGSHLALMMSLESVASGADKVPLVVHLPGFNEETVKQSPHFELYAAGTRYRKSLDTLITEAAAGRVRPDRIPAFKSQPGVTLDSADAWLAALLNDDEGGLAAQLRAMPATAVLDDLLAGGYVAGRIGQTGGENERVVWQRLEILTGLPASWREATLPPADVRAVDVGFAAASWALAVEYVHDLKRAPVNQLLAEARGLPNTVIDTCRAIAAHLRDRHAIFYERTADETEALLADEAEAARAADLGKIDTFRFEEDRVLEAALAALATGGWTPAADWAELRLHPKPSAASFWLRRDPSRQAAWELVHDAARLGQAIVRAGERLPDEGSIDAAVDAYGSRGAAVDQAHRHLEQRRAALLYPQLPAFETLRACLDGIRHLWRQWADRWARDFNRLCRTHGFLPAASLQQRTIFDDVVKPMAQEAGTTAYFMVDAFRFEMGDELYRDLADTPAATAQLKTRLAELPTVTAVGMNVLAPVVTNGRLRPSLSKNDGGSVTGFSTGEFRVFDPDSRKRAMHDRVGGSACPWLTLDDVVGRDSASLKRSIAQARLVVVHNREIDDAGERGVGPAVFDHVMQKLRAAWHLLRDAGVRRFVFTSDHGFLMLDESGNGPLPHGRRIDPKRRHVFSPLAADHSGEVRVALADLGYEGVEGYLMFPETTDVFDTGKRPMAFVHGGNSLQERAIPVLTVVHRAAAGGNTLQYGITATTREAVAGMHCLDVRIDVAQGALDFGSATEIELSLRITDIADAQIELCQTRGKARIAGGGVLATVGEPFELFFRLSGSSDARVRVELHHPGAVVDVRPCSPEARFAITPTRTPVSTSSAASGVAEARRRADWLEQLPEGGVRQVFEHLAAHGTVTEQEAATMLGGARGLRRFALGFETWVAKAPWGVRIDVVAGVKRYVREGNDR